MRGFLVFSVICLIILGGNLVSAANETVDNSTFEGGGVPRIAAHKVMKTIHFSEPVKSMEFRLSEHVWAGKPVPERVTTFPLGIADLDSSKNVYNYFRIKADKKINASVLDFLRVKISVDAEWIKKNDLMLEGVEVYFYDENGWTDKDVEVNYFVENSETYFYIVDLPDTGYYAIVEKENEKIELDLDSIEKETEEIEVLSFPELEEAFDLEKETNFEWLWILIIFIVALYFIKKKVIRKA